MATTTARSVLRSFLIDDEVWVRLDNFCKDSDKSKAEVVRELVEMLVKEWESAPQDEKDEKGV